MGCSVIGIGLRVTISIHMTIVEIRLDRIADQDMHVLSTDTHMIIRKESLRTVLDIRKPGNYISDKYIA